VNIYQGNYSMAVFPKREVIHGFTYELGMELVIERGGAEGLDQMIGNSIPLGISG
jgi:hypothetical protein